MSSCVGGFFSGVFKQAQIVPIKIMKSGGDAPSVSTAINAIGLALQDKANSAVEAGVLSMSIGFRVEDLQVIKGQPKNTIDPFADLLDRIKSANIVAVASSGNDKTHDLNEWTPRKNGGADTKMIVVGAADHNSQRCGFSTYIDSAQKGILSLYAIGEKVMCAGKGSSGVDTQYNSPSGSSPATAQVAGIVAMYLAQGLTTVADAKDYLLSEAKRLKGTNWPNDGPGAKAGPGPLRAGIGVQVPCTVNNARQATQPTWIEPDSQTFGDEIEPQRITDQLLVLDAIPYPLNTGSRI
ncbi:peptidase S8/S53 domain-containing protein [Hypomontagnella monticulosa]|nr:peptidase S8/S53 domain-containing protein [Hypomontagnella monticulosa]